MQPFSHELAKQRAWELKSSYMTYLINNKILIRRNKKIVVGQQEGQRKNIYRIISDKILASSGIHRGSNYIESFS